MPEYVPVRRGLLDDMRPEPFQSDCWLALRGIFLFSKSGMKSGDDGTFTSPVRERLRPQVTVSRRTRAYNEELERYFSYRPLDRRWFYNDLRLLNRAGPEMQRAWGEDNFGLYAMPFGTGAGPTVWCHALLPDYHSFSGRGGYAFPLYDRRHGSGQSNIVARLIEALSAAYGEAISITDVFDCILGTLSAMSYAHRFAEDLEDSFPQVVYPIQLAVFRDAARIGREIREVETFARTPRGAFERRDFVRLEDRPRREVGEIHFAGASIELCEDGSGRITGLPQAVWEFTVSGYRVLPRWLEARKGLAPDHAFVSELKDVCGRIAELIDLFAEADTVLDAALRDSLSREALGFEPRPAAADDERD